MSFKDNATPLDLLNNKNYTTREIRDTRYNECLGCDRLFKPTRTCRECGCFMAAKTWLKDAECPIGKWHRESE
jgi:rRNA maturation endonuclease Nob1